MRLVAAEREPSQSRSAACARLGPRLGVKTPTRYSWVNQAIPSASSLAVPGSVEELRAANAQLRLSSGRRSTANRRSDRVHCDAPRASDAGVAVGFEPICRVLEISPSMVRSVIARPTCARRVANEALKVRIRAIWDENYQVYGIPDDPGDGRRRRRARREDSGGSIDA